MLATTVAASTFALGRLASGTPFGIALFVRALKC
jgi:hypothetical protein